MNNQDYDEVPSLQCDNDEKMEMENLELDENASFILSTVRFRDSLTKFKVT